MVVGMRSDTSFQPGGSSSTLWCWAQLSCCVGVARPPPSLSGLQAASRDAQPVPLYGLGSSSAGAADIRHTYHIRHTYDIRYLSTFFATTATPTTRTRLQQGRTVLISLLLATKLSMVIQEVSSRSMSPPWVLAALTRIPLATELSIIMPGASCCIVEPPLARKYCPRGLQIVRIFCRAEAVAAHVSACYCITGCFACGH